MIKDSSAKDLIHLIRRLNVRLGIVNVPEDDILGLLIKDIREMLGEWKISEIENAFSLGLKRKIDFDMNLYNKPLNIVFMSNLMESYRKVLNEAIHKEKTTLLLSEVIPEPTAQERKKITRDALKASFEEYKTSGKIINFGNVIYQRLQHLINYDDREFKTLAYEQHLLNIKSKHDKTIFKSVLSETLNNLQQGETSTADKIKINKIVNDLKLKRFYDEVIEQDMNVLDFFEDE